MTTDEIRAVATSELRTVPEAAGQLTVSRGHVYGLINGGQLAHIRIGKAIRVPQLAIDMFKERALIGVSPTLGE